jgi:Nickel responsive protein SCO4226-like
VIYVVERYVPGISRAELERTLERLSKTAQEFWSEGAEVRYLGSTIVPEDEACFCQFEAASEELVAEINRRAGIAFDRIVSAVAIAPAAASRGGET